MEVLKVKMTKEIGTEPLTCDCKVQEYRKAQLDLRQPHHRKLSLRDGCQEGSHIYRVYLVLRVPQALSTLVDQELCGCV